MFNLTLQTQPRRRFLALVTDIVRHQVAGHERNRIRRSGFALPHAGRPDQGVGFSPEIVSVEKGETGLEYLADCQFHGYVVTAPSIDGEPAHMTATFQPDGTQVVIEIL